ncbi:unnamed protein product, partial [Oppiella nova]
KKRVKSLPSCPPEVWEAVLLEGYNIQIGSDVWQLAMMVYVCLTTRFPWDKADITDPKFTEFVEWQKRKTTRTPKEFRVFSPRLLRLMRRLMELKPMKRYPVTEVNKYLRDRWLVHKSQRASSVHSHGDFNGSHVTRSLSCSHVLHPHHRSDEWMASKSKDDHSLYTN